jgi:hypothetical protein
MYARAVAFMLVAIGRGVLAMTRRSCIARCAENRVAGAAALAGGGSLLKARHDQASAPMIAMAAAQPANPGGPGRAGGVLTVFLSLFLLVCCRRVHFIRVWLGG